MGAGTQRPYAAYIDCTGAFQFSWGKRRSAWHIRQILILAAILHDLFDLQMR
jgi:hypothetical protein